MNTNSSKDKPQPTSMKKSATNAEINQLVAEAILIEAIKRNQKKRQEAEAAKK